MQSGGNVGIGTTMPGSKFDVNGTITSRSTSNALNITSFPAGDGSVIRAIKANDVNQWIWNTATTWGLFWAGSTGAAYGTNGTGGPGNIWNNSGNPNEFAFVAGGNTKWTLGASGHTWQAGNALIAGNVGIGTTSPGAELEVAGQIKITGGTPGAGKVLTSDANGLATWTTASVPTGTQTGQMQYWNGTAWVTVAATQNEGATLQMIGGVPTWIGGTPPGTVPGAPTIGTATAGDAQASVPFSAPASNGGSSITSYTATSNPGNITGTLNQAGSGTITVTGLTNGISYTFTVTTTNSIGTSAASAASNSVTPTPTLAAGEVYNPTTGEIWMDRNLGASGVASSSTNAASYGGLYQWGRGTDGHQIRTSGWNTTSTLSSSDTPGHVNFILAPSSPYDWRSPQNSNLWQGVSGANNPCPSSYRLPTEAEWNAERLSWSSNNAAGAFASPLKLPVAGIRSNSTGSLHAEGSSGRYWSSTVNGTYSRVLYFYSSGAVMYSDYRANGYSVRCLKD